MQTNCSRGKYSIFGPTKDSFIICSVLIFSPLILKFIHLQTGLLQLKVSISVLQISVGFLPVCSWVSTHDLNRLQDSDSDDLPYMCLLQKKKVQKPNRGRKSESIEKKNHSGTTFKSMNPSSFSIDDQPL